MVALAMLALLASAPKPLAELPFVYEPGRIWLKATLNGAPVDALLDTGVNGNLVDASLPGVVKAKRGKPFTMAGAGGVTAKAWLVQGLRIGFPGTKISSEADVATDLGFTKVDGGKHVQVSLGSGFFLDYVVEVDYVHRRIRLYDPDRYTAPEGYERLDLRFDQQIPLATFRLRLPGLDERDAVFTFDTGSSAGIIVMPRMVRQDGLVTRFKDLPDVESRGSLGGKTKVKIVEGIGGRFGTTPLNGSATLSLDGSTETPYDVFVGDNLLRHFDLVFDYPHARLFERVNGK